MDVLESQHTEDLKEDHAAVVSLDDHLGLRLSAFDFFYRHTFVYPVLGMIMATFLLYAILYLYLTKSAPCPSFKWRQISTLFVVILLRRRHHIPIRV